MFKVILRFFGYLFSLISLGAIVGLFLFVAVIGFFLKSVPDVSFLNDYSPPTISRVYSNEGEILDEFISEEKRLFTPVNEIPDLIKHAFVSAEDKEFYNHAGYDVRQIAAALLDAATGGRLRGASTIPQQVAKIFVLGDDNTVERKIPEVLTANRLVNTLEREEILGLYLNEIFLGQNSNGVTAAARTYFNKKLEELSIEEVAYLASLPKAPSERHPVTERETAIEWRNFVIEEMFENGYINEAEFEHAINAPFLTVQAGDYTSYAQERKRRDYFTDEIRRQLSRELGEDTVKAEGLTVRATVDQELQTVAEKVLQDALEAYDRDLGFFHGPVDQLEVASVDEDWKKALFRSRAPRDIHGWMPAVLLETGDDNVRIGLNDGGEGVLTLGEIQWARYRREDGSRGTAGRIQDMLKKGDVIMVARTESGGTIFKQIPTISGAFAAMDPNNGRVLALTGGFSFESSNFNRATQAQRQPGSVFKPFVYAAALDSGLQPNALIVDAPIKDENISGIWVPQNAGGGYYGETPMMTGLEQSRNLMTIRLALDTGLEIMADYGERYGVYDKMNPYPANALGSQETTLYRLLSAFSTFANGGLHVEPTVVDRVQDRDGNTIYRHDQRDCLPCSGFDANHQEPPRVMSNFKQVMDPVTATQIRLMLQSAVARGTGKNTVGRLGLPIAGKTGTTNDAKDVWFVGFTPNIVAGCYLGYDNPEPLWNGRASGGALCGPVFSKFIVQALKKYGGFDFVIPSNGFFTKIDRQSGVVLGPNASGENAVLMFFRDGVPPAEPVVIDGGHKLGNDVPLIGGGTSGGGDVEVNVGGQKKVIPKKPTAGAITGGGLY